MAVAVLSGFLLALAAPRLHRAAPGAAGWLFALLPAGLTVYFAGRVRPVAAGETFRASHGWVPSLDVYLSFHLDGLSLLFALLVSAAGALTLAYTNGYARGEPGAGRLYAYLLMFMASMLGVVLAGDLLTLYVFWELTTLSSYLLIGFRHEREAARAAAWQSLLVTSGAGLAMLAGFVLLGQLAGTFRLAELTGQGEAVRGHPLYPAVLLLVLLGAFAKSAQFPFHFWLPAAMEAPTPVSAYLHSAAMVKAGVYLLARLSPALGGTAEWSAAVTAAGAVTLVAGGYLALTVTDLKRVLAYSTVSALGLMVLLLGVGTAAAAGAAVAFLLAHALYKVALFMTAGAVEHATGSRDADRLGGLRRAMPGTALAATLTAVSLAGFGPVLSFAAKEMAFAAELETTAGRPVLVAATFLGAAFFTAVAGVVAVRPFFGTLKPTPKPPHEAPPGMWLAPLLPAAAGFVLGLAPGPVSALLVTPAAAAVLGRPFPGEVDLKLWHGVGAPLLLSAGSFLLGVAVYAGWPRLRRLSGRLGPLLRRGPAWWYELAVGGLYRLAGAQTRFLQHGYLRYYLLTVVATSVALVGGALVTREYWGGVNVSPVRFYEVALGCLIMLAAVTANLSRQRLGAVAALGAVGFGMALVFILFGAPDLAMAAFLIETLMVVLFVLVLYRLPRFAVLSGRGTRLRDALIALAAGGLVTLLVLLATVQPLPEATSRYYAEKALPEGHGRNIVNVILVDFRAFDTLGEITVLAVASAGVYALLRLRPGGPAGGGGKGEGR